MVELKLISWIDEHLINVDELFDTDKFVGDLCGECLEAAFETYVNETGKDITVGELTDDTDEDNPKLLPVILKYDQYWKYVITYMKERYQISLFRYTDVMILKLMMKGNGYDIVNASVGNALSKFIDDNADSIEDLHVNGVDVKDLIPKFFDLLSKLPVYYPDRDMYTSDEDIAVYDQLNLIYTVIMTGNTDLL